MGNVEPATLVSVLAAALAIAMGLVRLLEVVTKAFLDSMKDKRRTKNGRPSRAEQQLQCRLTEQDRENLIEAQNEILTDIRTACLAAATEERITRAEHGSKLDTLIALYRRD